MVELKRTVTQVLTKMKKPVDQKGIFMPSLGIFLGLFSTGFISEMAARATGKIGYYKASIKSLTKILLGIVLLGAGHGFPGANIVLYPAALASFGSIPFDWIDARWPGGIYGFAEKAAVVIRTWSFGVGEVQKEIADMAKLSKNAKPNTILETRGEVHFPYENTHTKAEVELQRMGVKLSKDHMIPPEAMRAESPLDVPLSRS